MQVFKFGGASVKDAPSFHQVAEILRKHGDQPMVMVLSAMGKSTNALESIVHAVFTGKDPQNLISGLISYHEEIANSLIHRRKDAFSSSWKALIHELRLACETGAVRGYDELYARIVHMGERMSTLIMHHFLEEQSVHNILLDARALIRAGSGYREATVDREASLEAVLTHIPDALKMAPLVLTQGFIGSGPDGAAVTLGREGSDYTAALLGAMLKAEAVTIWKDVPGVLTADPREFPDAVPYTELPYSEAIELAYYGAKVIHPKTVKPLKELNIPLYVRPFDDPSTRGTRIFGEETGSPRLPSVILKRDEILVSLFPRDLSFVDESTLSHIFSVLSENSVAIDMMQLSALSFSFCAAAHSELINIMTRLFADRYHIRYNTDVTILTIRHYTEEALPEILKGKRVLLEQKTRQTWQFVFSDMPVAGL